MRSALRYLDIFLESTGALAVAALALVLLGWAYASPRSPSVEVMRGWPLLLLGAVGLAAFAWVFVAPRYVAPYVVLVWMGVFSSIVVPRAAAARRAVWPVIVAAITIMLLTTVGRAAVTVWFLTVGSGAASQPFRHVQWEVADGLHQLGVRPGSQVAVIGSGFFAYWARLGRFQIVGEVPDKSAQEFWSAPPEVQTRVIEAFINSGAQAVVTASMPNGDPAIHWIRIGATSFHAFVPAKMSR